jgi:uncharacterized protein YkwD
MRDRKTRRPIAGLAVALVATVCLGVFTPTPASASTDSLRHGMLAQTNHSRGNHSTHRLKLDAAMSRKAQRHSRQMASRGYIFHTTDPSHFYLRGVRWTSWGENVGETSGTVQDMEQAFMDSPPHKANILNGAFTHVAIGAVERDGYLWVTVFFYGK